MPKSINCVVLPSLVTTPSLMPSASPAPSKSEMVHMVGSSVVVPPVTVKVEVLPAPFTTVAFSTKLISEPKLTSTLPPFTPDKSTISVPSRPSATPSNRPEKSNSNVSTPPFEPSKSSISEKTIPPFNVPELLVLKNHVCVPVVSTKATRSPSVSTVSPPKILTEISDESSTLKSSSPASPFTFPVIETLIAIASSLLPPFTSTVTSSSKVKTSSPSPPFKVPVTCASISKLSAPPFPEISPTNPKAETLNWSTPVALPWISSIREKSTSEEPTWTSFEEPLIVHVVVLAESNAVNTSVSLSLPPSISATTNASSMLKSSAPVPPSMSTSITSAVRLNSSSPAPPLIATVTLPPKLNTSSPSRPSRLPSNNWPLLILKVSTVAESSSPRSTSTWVNISPIAKPVTVPVLSVESILQIVVWLPATTISPLPPAPSKLPKKSTVLTKLKVSTKFPALPSKFSIPSNVPETPVTVPAFAPVITQLVVCAAPTIVSSPAPPTMDPSNSVVESENWSASVPPVKFSKFVNVTTEVASVISPLLLAVIDHRFSTPLTFGPVIVSVAPPAEFPFTVMSEVKKVDDARSTLPVVVPVPASTNVALPSVVSLSTFTSPVNWTEGVPSFSVAATKTVPPFAPDALALTAPSTISAASNVISPAFCPVSPTVVVLPTVKVVSTSISILPPGLPVAPLVFMSPEIKLNALTSTDSTNNAWSVSGDPEVKILTAEKFVLVGFICKAPIGLSAVPAWPRISICAALIVKSSWPTTPVSSLIVPSITTLP